MTNPVMRGIAGTVAEVILAILVVGITESIGHALFPPPPGLDFNDPADRARLWEVIPAASKAMVVIAWFLGSLAGASAAIAISRRVLPGWTVGLAVAALGLWSSQLFPHPPWMVAAAMVLPLIAVLVAKSLMVGRLTARRSGHEGT